MSMTTNTTDKYNEEEEEFSWPDLVLLITNTTSGQGLDFQSHSLPT